MHGLDKYITRFGILGLGRFLLITILVSNSLFAAPPRPFGLGSEHLLQMGCPFSYLCVSQFSGQQFGKRVLAEQPFFEPELIFPAYNVLKPFQQLQSGFARDALVRVNPIDVVDHQLLANWFGPDGKDRQANLDRYYPRAVKIDLATIAEYYFLHNLKSIDNRRQVLFHIRRSDLSTMAAMDHSLWVYHWRSQQGVRHAVPLNGRFIGCADIRRGGKKCMEIANPRFAWNNQVFRENNHGSSGRFVIPPSHVDFARMPVDTQDEQLNRDYVLVFSCPPNSQCKKIYEKGGWVEFLIQSGDVPAYVQTMVFDIAPLGTPGMLRVWNGRQNSRWQDNRPMLIQQLTDRGVYSYLKADKSMAGIPMITANPLRASEAAIDNMALLQSLMGDRQVALHRHFRMVAWQDHDPSTPSQLVQHLIGDDKGQRIVILQNVATIK